MTQFFKKSETITVSRISKEGWWLENTTEHIAAGTAPGSEFTQHIYTPSKAGMTARYDRDSGSWGAEIVDMTGKPYWNRNGQQFVIGQPDGEYPNDAVVKQPPQYNQDTQTVLYTESDGWKVYDIQLGKPFYDQWGNELIVSDYNFELPQNHSWQAPPEAKNDHAVRLVNGEWQQIIDHREKMAYAKQRDSQQYQDYQIEEVGDIPSTHTLKVPGEFDSWGGDATGWQYDLERHRPLKTEQEKAWRNEVLTKVISRIDQYEKDQNYPAALRTSPIKSEANFLKLLHDRKQLSDYPESNDFPFGERPELSGLV